MKGQSVTIECKDRENVVITIGIPASVFFVKREGIDFVSLLENILDIKDEIEYGSK
jgi:hypothetical protein